MCLSTIPGFHSGDLAQALMDFELYCRPRNLLVRNAYFKVMLSFKYDVVKVFLLNR